MKHPPLGNASEKLEHIGTMFRSDRVVTRDTGTCHYCGGYTPTGMDAYCRMCVPEVLRRIADEIEWDNSR